METKMTPTKTVKGLPEAILAAIVAGHVAHAIESVKIAAKTSPTGKDENQEFDALYALDAEGMALLSGGKIEAQTPKGEGKDERTAEQKKLGACDHFNYGRLLTVRQQVRADLEARIEGPEKAIDKLVKTNVDGGMFDSESDAREAIIARWKEQGKLPADYAYPSK